MSNNNGNGHGTKEVVDQLIEQVAEVGTDINKNGRKAPQNLGKIGLALVPVTPVPFTGNGALYAWGRLILYGGLAAAVYKKNKTAATILGSAAGVSLLTSLAAKSWE